jgi:hypothetical protein
VIASRVESQRGSVGAMNFTSGMRRSDASRTSLSKCWTKAWRFSFQPLLMIGW